MQYKWELYCWVSLSSRLRSQEGPAIQMGGVLPYKLGVQSSVCTSKPREIKLFGGISRDFCRDILEVPEKFEKKKSLGSIFVP